jgi:hypothetical protein
MRRKTEAAKWCGERAGLMGDEAQGRGLSLSSRECPAAPAKGGTKPPNKIAHASMTGRACVEFIHAPGQVRNQHRSRGPPPRHNAYADPHAGVDNLHESRQRAGAGRARCAG